jgi:hypothetical protein
MSGDETTPTAGGGKPRLAIFLPLILFGALALLFLFRLFAVIRRSCPRR